jgi:catechol 2,3-dioxygenase
LGHVNIYVRNAEAARQWYEDILGLHTYDFKEGRAAFLSANLDESHEIALMEVGADAAGPQSGQVGLNHMAWRMGSLKDLEDFYNNLEAKNVPIARVSDHGLSLGIYLHDPDGNGIEVYYETPRDQWHRQDNIFMSGDRPQGNFPGPWEKHLVPDSVAPRT